MKGMTLFKQHIAVASVWMLAMGSALASSVELKPGEIAMADGWAISEVVSTYDWQINPDLIGERPGRDDKLRFAPILPGFQPAPIILNAPLGGVEPLPLLPSIAGPVQSIRAEVSDNKLTINGVQTLGGVNFSWEPPPGQVALPSFLSISNLRIDIDNKSIWGDVSQMTGERKDVRLMSFNDRRPSWIVIEPPGLTEPILTEPIVSPDPLVTLPLPPLRFPHIGVGTSISLVPGDHLLITDLYDLTLTSEGFDLMGGMLGLSAQDKLHSMGSLSLLTSITAVPEPAVGWLMVVGLMAVGARRRQMR